MHEYLAGQQRDMYELDIVHVLADNGANVRAALKHQLIDVAERAPPVDEDDEEAAVDEREPVQLANLPEDEDEDAAPIPPLLMRCAAHTYQLPLKKTTRRHNIGSIGALLRAVNNGVSLFRRSGKLMQGLKQKRL